MASVVKQYQNIKSGREREQFFNDLSQNDKNKIRNSELKKIQKYLSRNKKSSGSSGG